VEKRHCFQQMVLVQLAINMGKNANWSILISLYKTKVHVDQGTPHKTRDTESNRRESGEKSWTHGHRGKDPEQNTNNAYALRSRVDKWTSLNCKDFIRQRTLSIGQNGSQKTGKRSLSILHLIKGWYPIYTKNWRT